MSGLMEILLVVVIGMGIFLLPRMLAGKPEEKKRAPLLAQRFSGWMRLALMLTFLWPALLALYLKPWNSHWLAFLWAAMGPVGLAWGVFWVVSGFRKKRENHRS